MLKESDLRRFNLAMALTQTPTVDVDTLYPFGLTFKYTVTASHPFTFQIRIPEWAKNSQSTIAVNRAKATAVKPDDSSLQSVKVGIAKTQTLP